MSEADKPSFVRAFDSQKEREARMAKRFYKAARAEARDDGVAVLLDERELKTPARNPVRLPSHPLAEAVAAEWAAQSDHVDPASMPRTRIVTTAIDRVAEDAGPAIDEIARYGGSDLLCYRAEQPAELVAQQTAAWDPLLAWLEESHAVRLASTSGIMHVTQDEAELVRLRAVLSKLDPLRLTALHTLVTISGSAVIGLAVLHKRLDAEGAFETSRVDELFQISQWGEDAEAAARTKAHKAEFDAAAEVLTLLG